MLPTPSVASGLTRVAFGIPVSMIGISVKGDLAGQTIYTDRHYRKVFFPQAPPAMPPSPMQVVQRERFAQAISAWRLLSCSEKTKWESISLKASLAMTGLNLFIHVSLKCDFSLLATLIRQTGVFVYQPDCIPWPDEGEGSG